MKKNNPMKRRRFLAGAGLAAAGATVVAKAQAETGNGSSFTPQRHAEDSWMDELVSATARLSTPPPARVALLRLTLLPISCVPMRWGTGEATTTTA